MYSRVIILFLDSLHENTEVKNRVCSITTYLKTIYTEILVLHGVRTPQYCLKICIDLLQVLNKNENFNNVYLVLSENRKN